MADIESKSLEDDGQKSDKEKRHNWKLIFVGCVIPLSLLGLGYILVIAHTLPEAEYGARESFLTDMRTVLFVALTSAISAIVGSKSLK